MPQVLKEEVQKRIVEAALRVFADKGYAAATMTEIAASAGISTGNIYRYYDGKEALFEDALDPRLVKQFTTLLHRRVRALEGVDDVRRLEPDALYNLASEDLLRFVIENRLRIVILLGRAQGTRWERFANETIEDLIRLAVDHMRILRPDRPLGESLMFNLRRIYENMVTIHIQILAEYEDESKIRAAVNDFTRYHLAGMRALLLG
jgi:AcrR family transcriptional regulator